MNSKLFELAAKSRRTLEDGEKLCFRGTEVIKSTHGLLGDIQLLYPRLVFFQDFLDQQIEGIDTLLQLSRNQLYRLDGFLEIKSHDTDNLLKSLDLIIGRLKDSAAVHTTFFTPPKSLDANEMQADLQGSESKATLFDYVDIEAMLTCRERLTTELERKLRGELFELISKVQLALDEFKNTLQEEHSSISLEESGAQYAKEKSDFQERQANTMAQALLSVTSHYDQIKDALRDTEELSSISDELVQSLRIIETVHEDAIVRQQLFHMVYQEKTEFFRKISSFNSTYSELCELVKSVDSELESGGAAVEKYLEELWGLGSW
ncbi:hypothetical protein L0F63_004324 [Massospora cicadina]|nr:hypothetical protein L0F63_004324 [Massospora cicadina]